MVSQKNTQIGGFKREKLRELVDIAGGMGFQRLLLLWSLPGKKKNTCFFFF